MTVTAPRRALLYARVSKLSRRERDRQDVREAKSVDQQLAELSARAHQEGVEIIGVFRDDGVSASRYASTKVREGWRDVMSAIVAGQVTELWCWEISRATRDRPVWANLVNACIAQGVLIVVNGRVHDPVDPDDGFMLDLGAALAVRESAVTSKRILRDVAARATAGNPHGKIPYGYRREYDPATGALVRQVIDEVTGPIVAEMARRVLAGESMYSVAHELNGRGVPSPETARQRRMRGPGAPAVLWRPDQVKEVLLSPTIAGQRVHRGVVVAAATWPGIIPATDHLALVAKLATPGRKSWRDGATKHLLTGLAECGVCGAPVRQVKNRSYPSYACAGKDRRGASCVTRLQGPVDEMVEEAVVQFMGRDDIMTRLAAAAGMGDGASVAAAREAAELRAQLESFIAAAARPDGISPEVLAEVERRLRPQIVDADRRARPSSVPPVVTSMAGPDAAERWRELSVPQRRQIVRFLMRVIIRPANGKRGDRGFDPKRIEIHWRIGHLRHGA